jgi:hypothetical protein
MSVGPDVMQESFVDPEIAAETVFSDGQQAEQPDQQGADLS